MSYLRTALFLVTIGSTITLYAAPATTAETELIPRSVLFGDPVKANPKISPDGEMMAYLAPVDDVLNVWVKTIGKDDDRPVTHDTTRAIFRYFWASDNEHVLYLQDREGNENWLLYSVNIHTEETQSLTPFEDVRVEIVDRDKHFPNELIISMNRENPQLFDVYRLDLTSGELKMVAKNPGNIAGWVTDTELKVRGALAANPDGSFTLLLRETEAADWDTLITWDSEDILNSDALGFSKDGEHLYLLDSRDANTSRLVKMRISSREMEVIAGDPYYDVSYVMFHPDEYEVQAVSFTKARQEWIILDESIREDFDAISALDHGDFIVYNRNDADDMWLVGFVKDNGPVSYYAFDRNGRKGVFLFDHKPDLNNYTLASMEPVSFTSRDGLTIHGYITFPVGEARTNLPMILNVHGGPWARDHWGYNPEVQWLANRGYVCLQVNFRGSTGYGKQFANAGDREWGGRMQDDLVDAVKWAIEEGIADPDRITIFGGSYGGYAALVGATFTPELFCCAVDAMGPSNLLTWITSLPPYASTALAMVYKKIGNPETEAEFLRSRSPLFRVDQIKIPMLIAQGANDPRVKQTESEQIVEAMKEKGIDYEYLLFSDEGHGFLKPENRLTFYAAAEKFLAKHCGGRYEEAP